MVSTPQPLGVLGKFELLEELGGNRVFITYRARKHGVQGFEKIVALKILRPERTDDPGFTSLLSQQAGAAAALNHANIVQLIEVAEEDLSPVVAFEYVHGMDLQAVVDTLARTRGSMPASLAAFIASEVCKALEFTHKRGRKGQSFAHGALHPRNVLLSYEGEVKVSDFLLSEAVLTGETSDPAEDVAAVGGLLASLLAMSDDATQDLESAALAAQALDPTSRPDAGELFRMLASALFATKERPRPRELATFLSEVGLRPPPIETGRIEIHDARGLRTPTPGNGHDEALDPTAPDVLRDAFGVSPTVLFVGRDAELEALGKLFDEMRLGAARIVAVDGPTGSGKTRLLAAFGRRAIRAGAFVAPLALRRDAAKVPLHAIRSLTRALIGVPVDAGPTSSGTVSQLIREFALTPYESEIARSLALGEDCVGLSPSDRVRPIARVLRRIVSKLTADAALVVLVDDLQHLDTVSKAVLDDLLRRVQDRAFMLLCSRPPSRKDVFEGSTSLHLQAMADEEIESILAAHGGASASEGWRERIAEASRGNPRIAVDLDLVLADLAPDVREEILASPSLEQLAMDRVGRLPAHERHTLGIAGSLGTIVDPALLSRVAHAPKDELVRTLESLAEIGVLSRRPAGTYAFSSEALLSAALRELGPSEEPALHRFIAAALAEAETSDPHVWCALLLEHAQKAGVRGPMAGEIASRGRRLAASGAGAGLDLLLEALRASREEMEEDTRRPLELSLEVGELALKLGRYHEGVAALRFGRVLARRAGDPAQTLRVLRLSARLLTRAERYSEAFRLLKEAHSVAEGMGDAAAVADAHGGIGEALTQMGEFLRAKPYLETALQYVEPISDTAARLHGYLSLVTAAGGDVASAREHAGAIAGIRKALPDDGAGECELLKVTGLVQYALGDIDASVQSFETGLQRSIELGFHHEASVAAINLADSHLRKGEVRDAFAAVRYAYEVAREHGFARVRSLALYLLGYIDASVLDSPEGRKKVEAEAATARTPWDILQTRFALGRIDARTGNTESAIAQLREALEMGRRTGNLILEPDILTLLGELGVEE